MTPDQMDLFHPRATVVTGPQRRETTDPELWEAVMHPDGLQRVQALLEARHGSDYAAIRADLEDFLPPNPMTDAPWLSDGNWAGWLNILHARHGGTPP